MNAREMGLKGGRSKSAAKAAAARRNGRRGGRPKSAERFAREVRKLAAQLAPRVPQVDPHDLGLIAECLLKPPARRLVFMFPLKRGGYVF